MLFFSLKPTVCRNLVQVTISLKNVMVGFTEVWCIVIMLEI